MPTTAAPPDAPPAPGRTPSAATGRLAALYLGATIAAAAGFLAVYAVFVRTHAGQRWDNAALAGRSSSSPAELEDATARLSTITITSLAVALVVILALGLLRRRLLLGLGAANVVVVALVAAEVLKRALPRPDLVDGPAEIAHNSFPSGHTTIAMSLMFAAALVAPYGWRLWVALLTSLWGGAVGAFTVVAGWHRPSDTFGADLLALGVACTVLALLAGLGRIRRLPAHSPARGLVRLAPLAPVALIAVVGLGLGGIVGVVSAVQLVDASAATSTAQDNAFLAGYTLAAGASAATILALLALLHRVDVGATSSPDR